MALGNQSEALLVLVFLASVSISFGILNCGLNPNFNYPNTNDGSTFYSCSGGSRTGPRNCAEPSKTVYDPYTDKCDWKLSGPYGYGDCTGIVDGRLITNPNASDCTTCYKCVGGQNTIHTCPSDSKYDPNQMACDFDYNCN